MSYATLGIAATIFAAGIGGGWYFGGMSDRLACANNKIEAYKASEKIIAAEIKRTDRAETALAKALAKSPQTGKKVADAVRNNPAPVNCVVPDAVVDSLQQGIDSGKPASR